MLTNFPVSTTMSVFLLNTTMSNISFFVILLIVSLELTKDASGKTFMCDFDICDTADKQYCNVIDKRCHYCTKTECIEGIKECEKYCDEIYKTTTTAKVTKNPSAETYISNIGFQSLSPELQVITVVVLLGVLVSVTLLISLFGYTIYHRKQQKKEEIKIQISKSSDSGVFIENENSNQTTPLMSSSKPNKFPVQAVANKDPYVDATFDPNTSRLLAGDASAGGSFLNLSKTNSRPQKATGRYPTNNYHEYDTRISEFSFEEQETNLKSTL